MKSGFTGWIFCFVSVIALLMLSGISAGAQTQDAIGIAGWQVNSRGGQVLSLGHVSGTNGWQLTVPGPVALTISVVVRCAANACKQPVQYSVKQGSPGSGTFPNTSLLSFSATPDATTLTPGLLWNAAPGQYQLDAVVDPNHNYGTDSGDNAARLTVVITNSDPVAIRGWALSQNGTSIPVSGSGNSYTVSAVAGAPINFAVMLQCNLFGCTTVTFRVHQTVGQGSFDTGVVSSGVIGPTLPQAAGAATASVDPISWTPPAAGQYQFTAIIDPNNQFGENASAAADNTETLTLTVAAPSGGSAPSNGAPSENSLPNISLRPKTEGSSSGSGTAAVNSGVLKGGQGLAGVKVPPPCCVITAINSSSGIVTAKVNSTGQLFQFTLAARAALAQLRAGEGVYANFGAKQISLDGKSPAGTIMNVAAK